MRKPSPWPEWIQVAIVGLAAVTAYVLFHPGANFNLWDNFESFTPNTLYAHSTWLSGNIPILNHHQSLGYPLLGSGQSAAFYPPYLIATLVIHIFGLSSDAFQTMMALFHIPLGLVGWFLLIQSFTGNFAISLVFASGLMTNGFFFLGLSIWQHIGPTYSWFAFVLLSLREMLRQEKWKRWAVFLSLSWFMLLACSHLQQALYIGIHTVLFLALLLAWGEEQERKKFKRLLAPLIWSFAVIFPLFTYTFLAFKDSTRSQGFIREIFFEASLEYNHLLGFVSAVSDGSRQIYGAHGSVIVFAGLWMVVGIIAAIRRFRNRQVLMFLLLGLLFLDFALGKNGIIYPWTAYIPIWNSFRWPFKFTFHFMSMFAVAGAMGIHQLKDNKRLGWWILAAVSLVSLAAGLPKDVTGWSLWIFSFAMVAAMIAENQIFKKFAVLFVGGILFLSFQVIREAASPNFYTERLGDYQASYFGNSNPQTYRFASMSLRPCQIGPCVMQPLGVFDSATANNYLSVSGCQVWVAPRDFMMMISGNVWGVASQNLIDLYLGSPLFRRLGVKYYLAAPEDASIVAPMMKARGLILGKTLPQVQVFEDPYALPPASVPASLRPDNFKDLTVEYYGHSDPAAVFVKGLEKQTSQNPANARIGEIRWIPGRGMEVEVTNSSSTEVLVNLGVYPHRLMEGYVDDKPAQILNVNRVSLGLWVPPGTHTVKAIASAVPFWWSLAIAFAGLLLAVAFGLRQRQDGGL